MKKIFNLNKITAKFSKPERGDTIVEVMISLMVLSLIIVTVYAMSARSLRVGGEANQRTEALSYAQSQIDLLVNAKNNDPNFTTNYATNQAYCLNTDGTINTTAQTASTKLCPAYNGSAYSVGVSYSSNVFTITTQWPSQDAPGGIANINLYYKLPGVYKKALVTATTSSSAGTTATIDGTVNPASNIVTDCYFNYDTSTTYSQAKKAACSSLPGSGDVDVAVSAAITGLSLNTTYYFQICAVNLVGTSCSSNNGTFTTPSAPVVSNEVASNTTTASGNTATLSGYIDPKGYNVTSCFFEYGLTTSYGSTSSCGGSIGTTPTTVSANIASLVADSTYHWRLVAVSSVGNGNGADATFMPQRTKPPIPTLTAASTSIAYNASTTLSWTSTNATSCTGTNFSTGSGSPANGGPVSTGNLTATTTFTVTCTGAGGSASAAKTVTVAPAPPPPSAWLCGNFWDNGYVCRGPFAPGDYGWVEEYGVQNDNLGWVLVQNTIIGLYAGIYLNTYDGGGGVCYTLSSYKNAQESLWTNGIGGTSSFTVGRGC